MATKKTQMQAEDDISARLKAQAAEQELEAKHAKEAAELKRILDAEAASKAQAEAKPSYQAFKLVIENYKKQNPVKYELKKEALEKKLASLK
jgi:hypothetical protein